MEPRIEARDAQPYLAIFCQITDGVPAAVDTAFPQLFGWLSEHGIAPAGPPFMRFLELDGAGEPLQLEVAVPVASPDTRGDDLVRAVTLPAGRYVTLLHVGPYRSETLRDLGAARADLLAWIEQRGIAIDPRTAVEYYRVGPPMEHDFTKWETEFAYLVSG